VCVDAGPCRPPRLPASLGADDPVRAHEALHAAPWHGLAGPQQGLPHPPIAVGAVVGRVQFAGASEQPLVGDGPRAALAARAPRLGGRRHAQVRHTGSTPKRSRCVSMNALASVGLVEPLGENTDADSRISFARRGCRDRGRQPRAVRTGTRGTRRRAGGAAEHGDACCGQRAARRNPAGVGREAGTLLDVRRRARRAFRGPGRSRGR
jgi:hypothetical protein